MRSIWLRLSIRHYHKTLITSNRVVKLSWLENAYSRPVLSIGDLHHESRSGTGDLAFDVRLGFARGSVHACKSRSVCVQRFSGLVPPWLSQNLIRTFWPRWPWKVGRTPCYYASMSVRCTHDANLIVGPQVPDSRDTAHSLHIFVTA